MIPEGAALPPDARIINEMPPRIIFNADDFGFSPGVNAGIIECLERGLIRSATILVNAPAGTAALDYARDHPAYGFGLHFNLTWGRPLSSGCSTLCGVDGGFLPAIAFLKRLISGGVRSEEVEREACAQIRRCHDHGVIPSHVDSHKHLHLFGPVHRGLVGAALKMGVRAARLPRELMISPGPASWKAVVLRSLSHGLRRHLAASGVTHNEWFYGSAMMGHAFTERRLSRAILTLPESTVEIMVHPGRPEADFAKIDPYVEGRAAEIEVLGCNAVQEAIAEASARLIDFRDLTRRSTVPL